MDINEISGQVVDSATKVHRALGPGLLESAYEACLAFELHRRGLKVETQVEVPIHYEGMRINVGYRIDVLVEDVVIVELKCVDEVRPIHRAQLLSYLKLRKNKLGLLINFHVNLLSAGDVGSQS